MSVTASMLVDVYQIPQERAEAWADPISAACHQGDIDTPLRICAFLAQIGHESGRLRYVRELWGPTDWQRNYEGRKDLGNTEPGDGFRFRGRGLIQITGRANYALAGAALNLDLLNHPELLEDPVHAAMSAAWFWDAHGLNALADAGDLHGITHVINGGYNGMVDRQALYERALEIMHAGGN